MELYQLCIAIAMIPLSIYKTLNSNRTVCISAISLYFETEREGRPHLASAHTENELYTRNAINLLK